MRPAVVELIHVRLPLVRPFVTRRGAATHKEALLVRVRTADGVEGWGECAAEPEPTYAAEHIAGVWTVLHDHLVPRVLAGRPTDEVVGNAMAKAALEMALLDAMLRAEGTSLARHLGGTRTRVPAGVVVELYDDPAHAAEVARGRRAEGYTRIKLKIAPGRDLAHVDAVRAVIGRETPLWADANGGYSLDDIDTLRALDVDLLEQPLRAGDLVDHAELAKALDTPVCLDESVASVDDARVALRLGSMDALTVKAGRLGGLQAARDVHDLCVAAHVPLWVGGMLETGIGRAANVALASLPGFDLPGDLSASRRYFADDLTEPFELDGDGYIAVPDRPGLGVSIDEAFVRAMSLRSECLTDR
ncbi:MAG TPA: o-succinylbenzoate synthase [Acidimicrobiales bacterium]|nr:o-succinylbenzoate synthase [Acidimicrobiales bacterium]